MKYKFNHDAEELPETIGITDRRWDEIGNTIQGIAEDCMKLKNIDPGLVLERSLNKIDPKSIIEASIVGYLIAKWFSEAERKLEAALTAKFLRDMQE